ncbi:Zn-ribbon domain-containing OB-fold protein [Streptomyces sp. NPDC051956]|uniref:Zn-ribbon domain-containing OB-fold protein n=1 Tax=Streptomyces sp. NPDC051956 TaxID=3365677 RepID=UPI0037CED009
MTVSVIPNGYIDTGDFWAAARAGRLVVQYDKRTGVHQWFPRALSLSSGRRDLQWREVSGQGTLYSWTVTHSPWPGHEDRVPYVCALVDLDEGVRMLVNLVTDDPGALGIGARVRLVWLDHAEGVRYPAFEVAS